MHEWGHVFSLADHDGDLEVNACSPFGGTALIMSQLPDPIQPNPCTKVPQPEEVCSAWNAYEYTGNADANFIDLPLAYDDLTMVFSDSDDDGCDLDADNDGLLNAVERFLPCPSASGPTQQRNRDTDGDRFLDGVECVYGTDPVSASSVPVVGGTDSDGDKLNNALEATIGSNPNDNDSDDDGVLDGIEWRHYLSSPIDSNTDDDSCNDGREIASINADQEVNVIDLQQISQHFGPASDPDYLVDFDVTKSGSIDVLDLLFVSGKTGPCP